MNHSELIRVRQSCRAYDHEKAVEKEKLNAILEAGRLAPSACNGQPYHITVCEGETAKKVAEFGYKKSIKGKSMAIVGLKNRLTVFACRFFPRKMVTMVSAKNMKKE